jgi:Fur family ferric uptake transcriptional regulator
MNSHRILERAGLRPTYPRVLVLEFFQQHAHDHVGAEQVYKTLNQDMHHVSMASVYRALSQLLEAQLLCGLSLGAGRMAYELNEGKRHDHLVCTECGRIFEFFDAAIDARQKAVANEFDFTLSEQPLMLFGLCAECRKRRS